MNANATDNTDRHRDRDCLASNPDWQEDDSVWKVGRIGDILNRNGISCGNGCDVSCGTRKIVEFTR